MIFLSRRHRKEKDRLKRERRKLEKKKKTQDSRELKSDVPTEPKGLQ